ncbi:MAG: L-serine ammonia-lyase, iron-sulfur-dependent, subunit alpha [Lutisporaceae bacterium]
MISTTSSKLIDILRAEVKPALGCTEPGAVALAAARAREILDDNLENCDIYVSPNIYKNGMGVGIPGTDKVGLMAAACMGIAGGDSSLGLSALEGVGSVELELAKELTDSGKVQIHVYDTIEKIYIEVNMKGTSSFSKVVIRGRHDEFVYVQKNEEVFLSIDAEVTKDCCSNLVLENITIEKLIREIEVLNYEDIKFLLEGINMNKKVCEAGLSIKLGAGVGYSMKRAMEDGIIGDDVINKAVLMTSAAADARMSGINLPVMSSNGSGNHGLTAILPIAAYDEKFPQGDERLARALAISHLVTAYIKNFTGRLSAVCGCGVAASTGAAAGVAWLMDLNYKQIEGAIQNMIGNLSGMICDGAKAGCSYKLASAAGAAIQSALYVKYGSIIPILNGIVGSTVEESIKNLGIVSDKGMTITDRVIVEVMDSTHCHMR